MAVKIEPPGLGGVDVERETTRRFIAYLSLGGFFGLLLLIVVIGWFRTTAVDDTVKLVTTTASVLAGVVGAIVGFYFQSDAK